MTESIEQFLKRGGQIRKVDFTDAYKKCQVRHIDWDKYKKKSKIEKQKIRDAKTFRGII
jgi:hypothetical protein